MGTIRLFNHHVHKPFLWLALIELLLFILSVYLGAYLRFEGDAVAVQKLIGPLPARAFTFALALLLCMTAMGMYQPHMREGAGGVLLRTLGAFMLLGLVLSFVFYLLPDLFLGRGALALAAAISFLFVYLNRSIFSRIIDDDRLKRNVLVYGAGTRANTLLDQLRRKSDRRGFRFAGFVHVNGEQSLVDPAWLVHLKTSVSDYARNHNIDEIVIAVDDRRGTLPVDELLVCKLNGVVVYDLVAFFERESGRIMLELVTPGWLVFSDGFQFGNIKGFAKRAFDLTASFLLLMVTWPIMLLTVIAIWIEDGIRAPIVYRQERVGLNGKVFSVLKFRSMSPDAEKDGKAVWAKKHDDRVTRVGRFIRRCRIDELPQIINVLAGEMAFVGPRPERPQFVQRLTEKIPHYAARHQVKPGLAGWAQLRYPYGATDEDAAQKLQYDLYYVKNSSLFLDFLILVSTLEVVLFGKGAR